MYTNKSIKFYKIKLIQEFLQNTIEYRNIRSLNLKLKNNLGNLEHVIEAINQDYILVYVIRVD